jgi:DNA adenine methylase
MAPSTALADAIASAHIAAARARAQVDAGQVTKTIWGSPAGKKRLAKRLAAMLPPHRAYVEPFAGSAAVLFAKSPVAVEAINDADPEIAAAFRTVQKLTTPAIDRLRKLPWTGDKATFHRLLEAKPSGELAKLHRFLYLSHFSYGKLRTGSFSPSAQGVVARTPDRIASFAPRLAKVHVHSGDYEPVVRKYDGKDTAMFLDPPYAGYDAAVGEKKFDEHRFLGVLKAIKGKWLMTYGIRGQLPRLVKDAGFHVRTIRTPRTIRAMRGVGGPKLLTQLLVSNYEPTAKSLASADGVDIAPWTVADELEEGGDRAAVTLETRFLKAEARGDERYVLGIVLEPETVDAQADIYSADEIRKAAHRFLEEFGGLGLMHKLRVNDKVKVVESYLAPVDLPIGELIVKQGTWMLGVHVLDDALWSAIKAGQLTGFSIGGTARRLHGADAPGAPA